MRKCRLWHHDTNVGFSLSVRFLCSLATDSRAWEVRGHVHDDNVDDPSYPHRKLFPLAL
jgi:hypothetical protein